MDLNIDTQRAIGAHARDFRKSKKIVEAPIEQPKKIDKTKEAREMEAIVRNEQAVAVDAEALIKQRELLEDITDDEINNIVDTRITEEKSPVADLDSREIDEMVENIEGSPVVGLPEHEIDEKVATLGESPAAAKKRKLIEMFKGVGKKLADAFKEFEKK